MKQKSRKNSSKNYNKGFTQHHFCRWFLSCCQTAKNSFNVCSIFRVGHKSGAGFTLVEMMVAVALFSVVMVIGVGSLLSMISANKKSQSLQLVMSNLGFAIEDITRTMRVGTNYHCGSGDIREPKDCDGGSNYVAFEPTGGDPDSTNDQVVYRLNGTQIEKSTSGGINNSFIAITAPEITIESLSFYVQGSETIGEGDNKQPKVLIVLSGHAGENEKTKSNFNIQTMVSQRILDF